MSTKVLVTGALHPEAIKSLKADPSLNLIYKPDCSRSEIESLIADTQVLVTRSETKIDASLIDLALELKIIARAAVGVGNIDIPHATEKGILVINTPGKNTNSAAELTLSLLLGMFRNLPQAYKHMKEGGWDRHRFAGFELKGKSIGVVGLGNVGHRVAKFAHGFDMKVYAYDPYIAPKIFERHHVTPCSSLKDLASKVDIVSVHVPLNDETRGMVSKDIFDVMRDGTYVVNAARGGIIDEKETLEALKSGKLAGAAIDTWEGEPKPFPELLNHPNVWCTPHIGATTEEAQFAIGTTVVAQVNKALEGGVVDYPVNLPQIGVIDNPLIKPYAILAAKIGSLSAQIIGFNPASIEISYAGDLAGTEQSMIKLGFVKGYVNHVVDGYVSYVNAQANFNDLGIEIEESQNPDFESYRSALKVIFHGSEGQQLIVGGIVFDKKYIRISRIDGYLFEVEPEGSFIVSTNEDKPGVIGHIGSFLAKEKINIDSFDLSRNMAGGSAMALIKVDSNPSHKQISDYLKIPHMLHAKSVSL